MTQIDRTCAFLIKNVPSLLHSFTSFISSSLSRFIPPYQTYTQNETPPSCFIHLLSVFYSITSASLPLRWLLSFVSPLSLSLCLLCCFFLYKKAILSCFSASVSLSVCLCPCGRLPGCLAAGGKWGHPVGDLIKRILRGEALPLAPKGPNRRGLVLLSFSSHSFCLCVSLCVINVLSFCLPSCKDVIHEVGEVFSVFLFTV